MKTTYLVIILISTIFLGCQQNSISTSERNMQEVKISEKDFANQKPLIIKTAKGDEEFYAVIIYSDDINSLKKNGIIIQSESKNFVTALIKKSDIKTINQLKSIKSIEFPSFDNSN